LLLIGATVAGWLASAGSASDSNLTAPQTLKPPFRVSTLSHQFPQEEKGSDPTSSIHLTLPITSTALLPVMVNGYPPAYPWTGEIVATYPNCTLTRLFGFVLNQYGEPEGDVWVHYWADNYDGAWDRSSREVTGDHNWDGTLDIRPRQVVWYACIVPGKNSWDCQSNTVVAPTSTNCETGIQVYQIDFRRN
jgi:hypothetical protein